MTKKSGCEGCRNTDQASFEIPFTMAFQPILDLSNSEVWGYESLVRGKAGEPAFQVLGQLNETNRYAFDQACRVMAIEFAGEKLPNDSTAKLSINFMPNAVYEPKACIRATLEAADRVGFDPKRLMFEFTEDEQMTDVDHVMHIVTEYKRMGFTTALDDFGAGYAGLALLAKFQTDVIKIDMELIRNIDSSASRRAILKGIIAMCNELDLTILAEGIETEAEANALQEAGVHLFQGYYFAKPCLETFLPRSEIAGIA